MNKFLRILFAVLTASTLTTNYAHSQSISNDGRPPSAFASTQIINTFASTTPPAEYKNLQCSAKLGSITVTATWSNSVYNVVVQDNGIEIKRFNLPLFVSNLSDILIMKDVFGILTIEFYLYGARLYSYSF